MVGNRKLARNGDLGSETLGSGRLVGNSEVGRGILAKFEVPCQSQLDSVGIRVDMLTPDQEQYRAALTKRPW